jgi:hypothetical protein
MELWELTSNLIKEPTKLNEIVADHIVYYLVNLADEISKVSLANLLGFAVQTFPISLERALKGLQIKVQEGTRRARRISAS